MSIFARALGADFVRLHPHLRRRFGFDSADRLACVGTGVMDRVWRGRGIVLPFLAAGTTRHILFPETGHDIPFTIENYAYVDGYGRETVTFVRTFEVAGHRRRRFDATMVYSGRSGTVIDFLGTHQHLAVELALGVDDRGGLRIRSRAPRFRHGVPCPAVLAGLADVREWYDEPADRFRIRVSVTNPRLGPVFGYEGSFTVSYLDTRVAPVPAAVKPVRENPGYG